MEKLKRLLELKKILMRIEANDYDRGMHDGLELAIATLSGKEPEYWGANK
jgi:hypothetical protein